MNGTSDDVSDEARGHFFAALLDDDPAELYDKAPCGYLSTSPEGTILKANQTFLTMVGYARQDIVGRRSLIDVLAVGSRIYYETHYAPMLQMQGSAREIAFEVVRADGIRLPVLVNAALERHVDGTPAVIRVAVFDATERREYERELLRAKNRAEEAEARAVELARTLQATLIPPAPPSIPGLSLAAEYRPAGDGLEVGGDFYDVFQVAPRDWVVVVGDVRGKGVEAAIVTALVRHTIRAAAVSLPDPVGVLEVVNARLVADETERFCTAAVVRLRRRDDGWDAAIGLAGHPQPLHRREGGPTVAVGRAGTLLGVFADPTFHAVDLRLGPGDLLVLYTDGVTEARCGDLFYGDSRLAASVAAPAGDVDSVARRLLTDVLEFQSGRPNDDIVVVAIQPHDEGGTGTGTGE